MAKRRRRLSPIQHTVRVTTTDPALVSVSAWSYLDTRYRTIMVETVIGGRRATAEIKVPR